MPADVFIAKLLKQYADQYHVKITDVEIVSLSNESGKKEESI